MPHAALSWPPEPLHVLLVLLVLVVGFWGGIRVARHVLRRRVRRTRLTGRRAEERALALLRRAGYRVTDEQVEARGEVEVDGVMHTFVVRADALARRRWRRYVVEVKGGEGSASALDRGTRRQLLEYARVFDVDGVLLVDAVKGEVHRVRFP